jgi:hypothetical protein
MVLCRLTNKKTHDCRYVVVTYPYVLNYLLNPLNADLNPIRHLLALLGAYHILHVSRIRVNSKYHDLYT